MNRRSVLSVLPFVYLSLPVRDPRSRRGQLTKYTAAPHPYLLIPDDCHGRVAAGRTLTVDVHLFGHGNRHLPYVIARCIKPGNAAWVRIAAR